MFIEPILALEVIFWVRRLLKSTKERTTFQPLNLPNISKTDSESFLSIIIPARNEAENITRCLNSLVNQTYTNYEVVVVDDGSTDGTDIKVKEIGERHEKIKLIRNDGLPPEWTGKNYALYLGVMEARGDWLLFIDADTELYPDAISKAIQFAASNNIDMLSFSPEQELKSLWEVAVQPVIFDFLKSKYNYDEINDPYQDIAAANGQFILIKRKAYESIGGHKAIKGEILEDVSLAKRIKDKGYSLYFNYGLGIARCRMYRSLGGIINGWSKNLFALLDYNIKDFLKAILSLGFFSVLPFFLILYSYILFITRTSTLNITLFILALILGALIIWTQLYRWKERGYPRTSALIYPLGATLAIVLFLLSAYKNLIKEKINWKGRTYQLH